MKTKGYSIWLIPKGDSYKKFSSFINRLSKQYSSPVFVPHVTLIGGLYGKEESIIKKTAKLALLIKPFKIQLTKISAEQYYLKALFVKAKRTNELIGANKMARKIFRVKSEQKYMPHLSLIYGNFPKSTKNIMIKNINEDLALQFEFTSVHLFETEGKVNEWHQIKEFKLGAK